MKKVWKVVVVVVLIALILGAVCVGVGILTGADTGRIESIVLNKFGFTPESAAVYFEQCKDTATQVYEIILEDITDIF